MMRHRVLLVSRRTCHFVKMKEYAVVSQFENHPILQAEIWYYCRSVIYYEDMQMKHLPTPPPLAKLAIFSLLAMLLALPAPVMAQVDWSILNGTKGMNTCPQGQTETRTGLIMVPDSFSSSSTQLSTASMQSAFFTNIFPGRVLNANVYLSLLEDGKTRIGSPKNLGSRSVGVPQQNTTFTNLKKATRYTAVISVGSDFTANIVSKACFKTEPDLEIPHGSGRGGDGPGDSWSSGCYAFSKDRNQINACLCGARNSSGQWARTDSEDGYEYIRDAAWRNRVGCTTN